MTDKRKEMIEKLLKTETMEKRTKCYCCEKVRKCTELGSGVFVCRECGVDVNRDGSSKNPS